jgi:putative membrane-bound dehydrogenase-like protein
MSTRTSRVRSLILSAVIACLLWLVTAGRPLADSAASGQYLAGVARIDVTPDYPIRLNGFGFRRAEAEGTRQHVWAKALALGSDQDGPAVLITVDNLGVPDELVQEVAARLKKRAGLDPARLAVTATHTHTAPMLRGVSPTVFGTDIPKEHQEHIDRYTREFTDKLEEVALAALKDRKPARLAWGIGKVDFAVNRRKGGGPVDHDLPLLVVRDPEGKVRALYVSYACHCVTLSDNKVSGDWAGFAQEHIERLHPDAVALVSVGCGADSNPSSGVTGDKGDVASEQGAQIAGEVDRLLKNKLRPVSGPLAVRQERIDLPLDKLPTRPEWEEKAKRTDAVSYHARVQLARLDRGEELRTKISYPITTWAFGDSLGLAFLPGEVVVDYSLRLKRELDGRRLWVNAYSNAAPCYIPSERVLKEGGYEGGDAMVYYDQPTRFAPGLEQKIIDVVEGHLGKQFAPSWDPQKTQLSRPLAPEQSLARIRTKKGLAAELVAAEPLVASPVAIDFGPDGKLWVAEMVDYPTGLGGKFQPGGRIRVLESTRGDGNFDKATIFLDNIPFPTGVTVWRKGVLVCAAPDILYAEDTDGDGKADVVRKLFSGFGTDNYQARVNSLEYGLDGWVYGSCGLFGGQIRCSPLTPQPPLPQRGEGEPKPPPSPPVGEGGRGGEGGKLVPLGDRDFRIKPDAGVLEPATGRTQQGRVRDDWGDWFGCDNSNLCRHYPLADHYLRRNPHAAPPDASVNVPDYPNPNRLFPGSRQLQLFKLSGPPGQTTAACGLGIYRDDLLGPDYHGDAFTCEPVNLLVHRLRLSPRGVTFAGRRAADEAESEFLTSTDNWFRPVQVRTGPDGCLWVVDMYRFVIEHPRWIPQEDLAQLDVRAGHDMGRVYRVRPAGHEPRPWPRLDKLDTAGLVAALDSPNGWQRDMAGQLLLWRADKSAVQSLLELAAKSDRAEARLHALCVLDGLGQLPAAAVLQALADKHPGVRRHAVRLSEKVLGSSPEVGPALLKLLDDSDAQVQLQVAYTLGEWRDPRAGKAVAQLALRHAGDPHLSAAVLSSVNADNVGEVLATVLAGGGKEGPPGPLMQRLVGVAAALSDEKTLPEVLRRVAVPREGKFSPWQMAALAGLLDALDRQGRSLAGVTDREVQERVQDLLTQARGTAADEKAAEAERVAAVNLLGRDPQRRDAELEVLGELLAPQNTAALQAAALAALGRIPEDRVVAVATAGWSGHTPSLKAQILDLLLSRAAWQRQLLQRVEKNEVPAGQIDSARRQRLLASKDEQVRTLAAKVFAGGGNPDRQKVLQEYRDVATLTGDSNHGKAVFAKTCSVCHRLQDVGHAVGPDLAGLANKSPQYLLQEILDPNRNVDTRYIEYLATTKSGRTYTGILASETATSITLRGQEGKEQVLLRSELDELRSSGKSLMPEGLEKELPKQDLADLIAYLGNQAPPPKKFPGNTPAVVRPVDGRAALLATNGAIYGGDIGFEPEFRNVGFWHGVNDHVVWTLQLEQAARYDVWLDWACADDAAGNAFVLEGGEPAVRGKVAGTGGWDKYRQQKIGTVTLEAGTQRLVLRPDGEGLRGALLDLRGVHLVPEGEKPK